jgi:hypothetical protein
VEDHLIAPASRDDLPVSPAKRAIGPPTIFDQPRFPDRVHGAAVDDQRAPVVAGGHGDAPRDR